MKDLIVHKDESGEWTVQSHEIPGFTARGRTQQEALEKMKQAFSVYYPCGADNCRDSK